MIPFRLRSLGLLWLALALECTARALVRFNDGTDQVYVNGTFSIGHSSNLSASSTGSGDYSYGASASIDYERKAGLITVNASASYTLTNYLQHKNATYDSLNPTYSLELDKGTGRTVGALNLSATRSAQADASANVHDVSWNYSAGLTFKYPIISRYSLSGSVSYGYLQYVETSGQPLVNLATAGASLGLFYILNDEHDLFATYRYRYQQASSSTSSADHALSVGVNGKVLWEINGNLAIGGQIRYPHGVDPGIPAAEQPTSYSSWYGSAGLSYAANKKLNFKLNGSKDFNTTSTDATIDSLTGSLDANYAYNAKLHADAGLTGGETRYLGPFGLLPPTTVDGVSVQSGVHRLDYNFGWNAGAGYSYNDHLHIEFSYTYLKNWSNVDVATFDSSGWTLTFSSHW